MSSKKNFFGGGGAVNTFIGGVGASIITNTTQLAAKLNISSGNIHNFSIDSNNNVSCYIGRNYTINASAFVNNNNITYYLDLDGKCTRINSRAFHNVTNSSVHQILIFPNVTSCNEGMFSGGGAGTRGKINIACIPKLEPIGNLGTTSQNNFSWCDYDENVYVEGGNATNNAGGPDADIASAISSGIAAAVVYSANTNAPDNIVGLNEIDSGVDYIEVGWTALTHSNSIDYYLVFANGNFVGSPVTNSLIVGSLTTGTDYEFKILAIDSEGNTNHFSTPVTYTTL